MTNARLPHAWLAIALSCLIIGAMIASAVNTRWNDPLGTFFGEFGIVTVVTGMVTVGLLAWRSYVGHQVMLNTQKALEHAQRSEIAVRYQKGMEMLASEHESTRIGGLYLLRDVVVALPQVYWASVSDSLFPFIRRNCIPLINTYEEYRTALEAGHDPNEDDAWLETTPPDVVIAIKILGRAWPDLRTATVDFELIGRHIRGLVLANVAVQDLSFNGISLDGAILQGANLTSCTFTECEMTIHTTNTAFYGCDLNGSSIYTNYTPYGPGNTTFQKCYLNGAIIDGSDLSEVAFVESDTITATINHPNARYY